MASSPSIFAGSTTISGPSTFISGNTVNINQSLNRESKAFETLIANVSTGALHDSGEISDPPKCHPGTRVDVINVLITWALLTVYTFPIRWLNGPAGAGKSAIMRTLAEMLVEKGLLLASFFFFRSDGNRNTAKLLISTIAYQLCFNIPPLRPHIERAIESNPLIFRASLSTQIQRLLVDPFLRYFYNPNSSIITPFPRIILIDGLDECEGHETQREILETFCGILRTLPIPLAIVVASRPERQIRIPFELGDLCQASSRVTLDDSFNPDKDIRFFYDAEFAKIRTTHPMRNRLGEAWPASSIVDLLVLNASGQFIYASTIVRFIKSIRHHPATRLQIILGLADRGTAKPFQQLDTLYTVIFMNVDSDALPDALRVLGVILAKITFTGPAANSQFPFQFHSPDFLDLLLSFSPGHVQSVLLDLESLLTATKERENIRIFHTSLADFLFDKSRAAEFFLDRGLVYTDVANACIKSSNVYLTHQSHHLDDLSTLEGHLARYIEHQLQVSLENATPTDYLRNSIVNFDISALAGGYSGRILGALVPAFLTGLRRSHFPDTDDLYQMKVASYRNIVDPILTEHWIKCGSDDNRFKTSLLLVLVLALTSVDDFQAISFVKGVYPNSDYISIFPGITHHSTTIEQSPMEPRIEQIINYNRHTFPRSLLDVIGNPDGLLHKPKGRAECTEVAVHLLQTSGRGEYTLAGLQETLNDETRIFGSTKVPPMDRIYQDLQSRATSRPADVILVEAVLQFILPLCYVQEDLTEEVKRVKAHMSNHLGNLRSKAITGAIDRNTERAVEDENVENSVTKILQHLRNRFKLVLGNIWRHRQT